MRKAIKSYLTPKRILIGIGVLSPAVAMLFLIFHYAINLPYSDDYSLVPMFQSLDHGHMPLGMLWAQHNEHRYFFPLLVMVLMGQLTHWNIIVELYVSFAVAAIGFAGIIMLIRRHVADQKLRALAIFLAAAFFFSPVQAQNWLWGFQLGWFLCVACTVWAVNLIDTLKEQEKLQKIIAPAALAFIATFTLGGGFLAWFGGLIVLLFKKFGRVWIGAWAAGAAVSIGLYYFDYHLANEGLAHGAFLHDIPSFVQYYLAYIGRPIANDSGIAVFAGLYLIMVFAAAIAYAWYKKHLKHIIAAASLGTVALVTGILIGVARFNYGMGGALSGVHTTFSILFMVSVIIMIVSLLGLAKVKRPAWAAAVLVAVMAPLIGYSWVSGMSDMRTTHKAVSEVSACSRQPQPDDVCFYRLDSSSQQEAKDGLKYLQQKHYGGY